MKKVLILSLIAFSTRSSRADMYCPDINGHSRHNINPTGADVRCVYDDPQKGLWDEQRSGSAVGAGSSLSSDRQEDSSDEKYRKALAAKLDAKYAGIDRAIQEARVSGPIKEWVKPCEKMYEEAKIAGTLALPVTKFSVMGCFSPHVQEYGRITGAIPSSMGIALQSRGLVSDEAYAYFMRAFEDAPALERAEKTRKEADLAAAQTGDADAIIARACEEAPLGANTPKTFRDCDEVSCPEAVIIPAGSFEMGALPGASGPFEHNVPRRKVIIAKPFAMTTHEILNEQYAPCVQGGMFSHCEALSSVAGGTPKYPVHNLTRTDAAKYARWLSKKTGHTYRLPSEAEWEYAARAGSSQSFPCMQKVNGVYANVSKAFGYIWNLPANAFGLYGMMGDVSEMTADDWHPDYTNAPTDGSPWMKGDKAHYPVRGGYYGGEIRDARVGVRSSVVTRIPNDDVGFRLVRELP